MKHYIFLFLIESILRYYFDYQRNLRSQTYFINKILRKSDITLATGSGHFEFPLKERFSSWTHDACDVPRVNCWFIKEGGVICRRHNYECTFYEVKTSPSNAVRSLAAFPISSLSSPTASYMYTEPCFFKNDLSILILASFFYLILVSYS